MSCCEQYLALNNIEHILIAASSEDSIDIKENDPEENEESRTADEENMDMQGSYRDEEITSMQYVSSEDVKLPTVSSEISIFDEVCKDHDIPICQEQAHTLNIDEQNPLDAEEMIHYEQSRSLDSIQHDTIATIYEKSLESFGTSRHDVTVNNTSSYIIHSNTQYDQNAGPLQFNNITTSKIDYYDEVFIYSSDTNDIQSHIASTCQEADILQYTASSDLPSLTDEPKIIDLDQNSHLMLASEKDYIEVDTT